jgi:outer membrane protein
MKNISLLLNLILIVAVAILYYLNFKKPKEENPISVSPVSISPNSAMNPSVVYVNTDSLLHNYSFYKSKKSEFEAKNEKIKNDLKAESDRLQSDAESYQQHANVMADAERQKTEEQLMARQQNLMKKKDDMIGKLDEEQSKFNEELYSKLTSYLREYNKGRNYTYILGFQKGGGILFANDSLDVTKQVLEGLEKMSGEKK